MSVVDDEADVHVPRAETGVPLTADSREARVFTAIAMQLDFAEKKMLLAGVGHSATRLILERYPRMSRKHANKLQFAVQLRWRLEGSDNADRSTRKAMLSARLEDLYRRSLEHKRALLVLGEGGCQRVEYAAEPDLKAAAVVLGMMIKLDGLDLPELGSGDKTPDGARAAALQAYAEQYGARALESGDG